MVVYTVTGAGWLAGWRMCRHVLVPVRELTTCASSSGGRDSGGGGVFHEARVWRPVQLAAKLAAQAERRATSGRQPMVLLRMQLDTR